MGTVEHRGGLSHHPHTSVHSVSRGHTLPSQRAGSPTAFADVALAAMRHYSGRQDVPGTNGGAGSIPVHDKGTKAAAGTGNSSVPALFGHFIGRSTGSGQCVALVYAANPGLGSTACWACGEPVQGNTSLQPGTVIATFDRAGRYANARDGSSHAAIYLGQNEQGVQVLDQWSGSPAAVRTIRWTNPGGTPANTGSAFRVVRAG